MKATLRDGRLVVTFNAKDEAEKKAVQDFHQGASLFECRISWDNAPKTGKISFEPKFVRYEPSQSER